MTPRRPSHLASFPSLGGTAHAALGVTETTWPPRFLGNPRARLPRSPTPVGPTAETSCVDCVLRRTGPKPVRARAAPEGQTCAPAAHCCLRGDPHKWHPRYLKRERARQARVLARLSRAPERNVRGY